MKKSEEIYTKVDEFSPIFVKNATNFIAQAAVNFFFPEIR